MSSTVTLKKKKKDWVRLEGNMAWKKWVLSLEKLLKSPLVQPSRSLSNQPSVQVQICTKPSVHALHSLFLYFCMFPLSFWIWAKQSSSFEKDVYIFWLKQSISGSLVWQTLSGRSWVVFEVYCKLLSESLKKQVGNTFWLLSCSSYRLSWYFSSAGQKCMDMGVDGHTRGQNVSQICFITNNPCAND